MSAVREYQEENEKIILKIEATDCICRKIPNVYNKLLSMAIDQTLPEPIIWYHSMSTCHAAFPSKICIAIFAEIN